MNDKDKYNGRIARLGTNTLAHVFPRPLDMNHQNKMVGIVEYIARRAAERDFEESLKKLKLQITKARIL